MNNTQHLLLVDDDEDDRYFMQLTFRELKWSHRLKLVESAQSMLSYLTHLVSASAYPSLILLDYNMPKMNGEEALKLLKGDNRFKSIPVVLYSTAMTETLRSRLIALGAAACYQKSITITQSKRLAQSLKTIIEEKERQQHSFFL